MADVPITYGTGQASIAGETIAGRTFQQVKIIGGETGSTSVLGIAPDGSIKVSILGIPAVTFSGSPSVSGAVTVVGSLPSGNAVLGAVAASISGTVATTQSGAWTTSVVGTVGASVIGAVPLHTEYLENAVQSSVYGIPMLFRVSDNTSVLSAVHPSNPLPVVASISGTAGASIIGTVPITGNVGQTGTIITSISGALTINPASVSGTVGASVIGTVPVVQSGAWTQSVVGTVATTMSGAWTTSVVGTVTASIQGNVNIASVAGAVTPYAQPGTYVSGSPSVLTTTASTLVLAAPSAPQRNYVTHLLVTNQSATGTVVNIVDNGQVIYSGYAAASGGGFSASFPVPLKQPTSVLALYVSTGSTSSVLVSASGYTAP